MGGGAMNTPHVEPRPPPDPERDDAPVARGVIEGNQGKDERRDSGIDADFAKLVATAKARAALAGFQLIELPEGGFLITRWGTSRELPHLAGVDAFLQRAGATA